MAGDYVFSRLRVPVAASVCQPAVRMTVIQAWASEGGAAFELLPVVAVCARTYREYTKQFHKSSVKGPPSCSEAELEADGWYPGPLEEELTALVVDTEYGLTAYNDPLLDCDNTAYRLVACPWPQQEDGEMLAEAIQKAKEEAAQKQQLRRMRRPGGEPAARE